MIAPFVAEADVGLLDDSITIPQISKHSSGSDKAASAVAGP